MTKAERDIFATATDDNPTPQGGAAGGGGGGSGNAEEPAGMGGTNKLAPGGVITG